ncbi:metal ABC transporter permease [Salmonella enterica subsp. enterica]|nr:metal ABC transporter permease [Salmonella enterica subsp. enterica]
MFGAGLVLYVSIQSEVHLGSHPVWGYAGISLGDIANVGYCTGYCVNHRAEMERISCYTLLTRTGESQRAGPPLLLHYGLLCMICVTIVAALKSVGIILSSHYLSPPAPITCTASATLCALGQLVSLSVNTAFAGVYLSFYLDSAPAPTINGIICHRVYCGGICYATWRDRRNEICQKAQG